MKHLITGLLVLLLTIIAAPSSAADKESLTKDIKIVELQIQGINTELMYMRERAANIQRERRNLAAQAKKLRTQLNQLEKQNDTTKTPTTPKGVVDTPSGKNVEAGQPGMDKPGHEGH